MPERVAFVYGGRTYGVVPPGTPPELYEVRQGQALYERRVLWNALAQIKPDRLIHGGAKGADTLGGLWAENKGIPIHVFPAQWRRSDGSTDRGAGHKRNAVMANVLLACWEHGDEVISVQCPGGTGTANMRKLLDALEFEVTEVQP